MISETHSLTSCNDRSLFFMGNALLDISAECDKSILHKYKLTINNACEATVDQEGLYEDIMENYTVTFTPGGSAQNSARVAQWMLKPTGSNLVTFVGCIGNDNYGEILEKHMKENGIVALYAKHASLTTGISANVIVGNDHTLCARLGSAQSFPEEFLDTYGVKTSLNKAKIIYVEGYFLSHSPSVAMQIAKFCSEHQKIFAFNLNAVYICENYFSVILELLPFINLLFGNEIEAEAIGQLLNCDTIEDVAKRLSTYLSNNKTTRTVIFTRGSKSVVLAEGNQISYFSVKDSVNVVDTVGAGDAFVGGMLSKLVTDASVKDSVPFGIYAASEIIKRRGCMIPSSDPEMKVT